MIDVGKHTSRLVEVSDGLGVVQRSEGTGILMVGFPVEGFAEEVGVEVGRLP